MKVPLHGSATPQRRRRVIRGYGATSSPNGRLKPAAIGSTFWLGAGALLRRADESLLSLLPLRLQRDILASRSEARCISVSLSSFLVCFRNKCGGIRAGEGEDGIKLRVTRGTSGYKEKKGYPALSVEQKNKF